MITFDFFDYGKNPLAEYCIANNKGLKVYNLDDMMPYIEKCPFSKRCLDLGGKHFHRKPAKALSVHIGR